MNEHHERDGPLDNWHLDKRVSVSHIFTTISMIGAAIFFIANLQSQIDRNSTRIEYFEKSVHQRMISIDNRLERIENKLDK